MMLTVYIVNICLFFHRVSSRHYLIQTKDDVGKKIEDGNYKEDVIKDLILYKLSKKDAKKFEKLPKGKKEAILEKV